MKIDKLMSFMYRILHKDFVEVTPKYVKTYKYGILVEVIKNKEKVRGLRSGMPIIDDWKGNMFNE